MVLAIQGEPFVLRASGQRVLSPEPKPFLEGQFFSLAPYKQSQQLSFKNNKTFFGRHCIVTVFRKVFLWAGKREKILVREKGKWNLWTKIN